MSVFGSRAGIAHIPPGRVLGPRPPVLTLVARIAKGLNEFNGAARACGSLFAQFRIVECDRGRRGSIHDPSFGIRSAAPGRPHRFMIHKIFLQITAAQFEERTIVNVRQIDIRN